MTAKAMDLYIEQGATYEMQFTWADVDESLTPPVRVPKDLTGCTARMQIRAGYTRPVMLQATTENGRITLGGPTGEILLVLPADVTATAPAYRGTNGAYRIRRRARYDLEVVWPDGSVDRVLQGKVIFSPNMTRDEAWPAPYIQTYVDRY